MEINVHAGNSRINPAVMTNTDGDKSTGIPVRDTEPVTHMLAWAGLILGPAAFALLRFLPVPEGLGEPGWSVAGVALLMAV
jgi:hypothetical protein